VNGMDILKVTDKISINKFLFFMIIIFKIKTYFLL